MLLMIDNYDSFTWNLVHYFAELGEEVRTVRNNAIGLDEIENLAPDRVVLSPGPCSPAEAGISVALVRRFAGRIPILGVCLGHQAIGAAFGARIVRARRLIHGHTATITHDGRGVFRALPDAYAAVRYHSLAVDAMTLPDCLEATAFSDDGELMGLRHRDHPVEGVQFHPESLLSEHGHALLRNFLES